MIYNKEFREELGGYIVEYLAQLETQIALKIFEQLNGIISTRDVEYKITKFLNSKLVEINWGDKRILHLFSPDGCSIAGRIIIQVLAEVPGTEGNLTKPYYFEVNFNSTSIEYNFAEEIFSVKGDVNINYITLIDRLF